VADGGQGVAGKGGGWFVGLLFHEPDWNIDVGL